MTELPNGALNPVRELIERGARMDPAFYTSESGPQADEVQTSVAISLKRIADMMEEDRKPRLEVAPEGYIGEQEHRQFMRDSFIRDLAAWEAIADAVGYIAGRMPLPKPPIECVPNTPEGDG
jgi:hypothetical protein